MRVDVEFVQIAKMKSVGNMKYLVGIKSDDFIAGLKEKEVEGTDFVIDTETKVLYFYRATTPVAAFLSWEYVRVKDEEA